MQAPRSPQQTQAQSMLSVSVVAPRAAPAVNELLLPGAVTPLRRSLDLRAHKRLPRALVHRHRRAGEERPDPGDDRDPGTRCATASGPRRRSHRAGQFRLREDHRAALAGHAEDAIGRATGHRHEGQRHGSDAARCWSRRRPMSRISPSWCRTRRSRAPFDGVITARNVDVGALVDGGRRARHRGHVGRAVPYRSRTARCASSSTCRRTTRRTSRRPPASI